MFELWKKMPCIIFRSVTVNGPGTASRGHCDIPDLDPVVMLLGVQELAGAHRRYRLFLLLLKGTRQEQQDRMRHVEEERQT